MMQTEMSNILLGLNISETVYKTTKIEKDLLFVTLMKPTIRPFFFNGSDYELLYLGEFNRIHGSIF